MKKEDFKLKQSTKDMFTGTQVGALLEDVDHKLEFIGEKVLSMETKMDTMEGKMDTMEGRMDRMEIKMDVMETKLDVMETKLDATFEAVGDIKLELTGIQKKDKELDRRVVVLEKRAVI